MKVCRLYEFAAAHHLPGHPKCGGTHGHNYRVEVEVQGNPGEFSGMVVDFADLDKLVKPAIKLLDHSDLNERFAMPTAEWLAEWLASLIVLSLEGISLSRVRVWENDRSWAEWNCGDPISLEDK